MRALLDEGKWRQARNDLKSLVKTDRARFLPLLIDANLGLAREMLASGQAAQARQVLSYLATIAPADRLRALEIELAAADSGGGAGRSPTHLIAALVDSQIALSEAQRMRLADQVVLAFEPEIAAADPAHARLAGEAHAVQKALQAVSRREWLAVSEALRRVPHRSAFSHWAVFVKGIAALHAGEVERSAKLLRVLPAGSVPAKAAQAYLLLQESGPPEGKPAAPENAPPASAGAAMAPEPTMTAVCRLIGAGGASGVLMRADRHWRGGSHAESYRTVREGVAQFPSAGLEWQGVLSEFYFKAPPGLPEDARNLFTGFCCSLLQRNSWKNGAEAMLAYRMLSLICPVSAPADVFRKDWEAFLREHQAIHGPNARLASLAYGWLGGQLATTRRARGFFSGPPRMRDPDGAIEALRRSIELDPANLAAHLSLCEVYGALKKRSERNRLLDEMTARFPDEKHVLVRAAEGCLERKAFGKGLDYLARARQLDQLDPRIPELTVAGLCQQARQQFQQRRPEKARQVLAQAEAWLSDKPDDFHRARWTLLVRQGLMERRWGEAGQAERLLAQARERAPSFATMLLFAHLTDRAHTKPIFGETPFLTELKKTLRSAPRLAEIAALLRLLEHWRNEQEDDRTFHEDKVIADAIPRALGQPFTRAEAAVVIERGRDNPEFARSLQKLVKKMLRTDPLDPQARLWQVEVRGLWVRDPSQDRAELQSILDEASRRRDEASLRKARQMLRDVDHPPPMPNPFGPDFAGPEFDAEEEEDELEPQGGPLPPDLPPEMLEEFGELLDAMRVAPDSALRELRKTATRQGMPDFIFEALIAAAKGKPLPPLPPKFPPAPNPKPSPPQPKPARPEPPVADPNQLNLF